MEKLFKLSTSFITAFLLSVLLLTGCQQEQNDIMDEKSFLHNGDSMSVSIGEAKAYFDANFNSPAARETGHKHTVEGNLKSKIANWNKAGYKKISLGEAVIIPLEFENLNLIVNEKTRAYVPYNQLNYLMMYKDKRKSVKTEWVTLLPDSSWLYGNKNIYTGDILVRNWEGKYIKMYHYKKDGTSQAFNIANPSVANVKNGRTSDLVTTYTTCMNMRSDETCTCQDKSDCDMCEICAPYVCFTVTLISEPYDPDSGSDGTGGGSISTGSGNGGGGGNVGGGNYIPNCNPNISPGTPVATNQALPCGTTYTPVTVINPSGINYNTFEGFENDPYYQPFFEELNEEERRFFRDNLNLIFSGARNFNEAINHGNWRFFNSAADNTNANAFRHMIWCGFNYISWDSENSTNFAERLGNLHELGQGTANQHDMDSTNNAVGINLARNLPVNRRNREAMSEAALNLMIQPNTPCRRLEIPDNDNSRLIRTDGTGRR